MFCIDSVDIHRIECIRDPCLVSTVSTYIVFDGMFEKPTVSVFQNFLWIENRLNIKKVIGRNVSMCFALTASTYTIECITCFDLHIESVNKQHSIHYSMHCML